MRKIVKSFLTASCLLITIAFKAQALSGTVTINSAQATGGTNYQSFSAFAAVVNTAGISGPLYVIIGNTAKRCRTYPTQILSPTRNNRKKTE